ncbi:phosphatase 2C domain-containing protein [Babesia ovata]|uniref:protein-serine/threonine phosphatase n=1 Tax=Babesia ovata TaxID=189622 RepID=A0A2H6KI84_9APIC|nr:phosphatase 2C domain-containing protein [Babesia ovata]GBE62691.1 phosphatase 2C domain-containing protein [Babesia ovata]
MGAHLSSPKTDKVSFSGGDFSSHTTRYGSSSMQGWRVSMEDSHLAVPDLYQHGSNGGEKEADNGHQTQAGATTSAPNNSNATGNINSSLVGVYGVFDGHGGSCVSQWVSENFANLLKGEIARLSELKNNQNIELKSLDAISETQAVLAESLQSAFLKVDEELQRAETEQALQKLNERPRSDNSNESFVDGSSLFKVLMPDRAPNRQHTIRLIEQHTERLLRESFNFHNSNQSDAQTTEDLTRYSEDDEDYQQKSPDDLDEDINDDEVYRNTSTEAHSVDVSNEGGSIGLNDVSPKNHESKTSQDQMVTRAVHDDESMRSGDCIPEDEYEVETDTIGDGDGPSLAYGCGSTSVVVVVVGGETPAILVANAGDSRAVLSRGGQAVALSHDHKPQLREEGERIRRAGGSVTNGRVDGNLNLSRSLGDLAFKRDQSLPPAEQRISAMPDVRICPLTPQDEFIVLACDGIWDCKSNQQVVDFVRSRLVSAENTNNDASDSDATANNPGTLAKICEELCDECLSSNPSESEGVGCDNMTVVIVQLSKHLVEKATSSAQPITLYGKQVDAYL